MHITGNVKVHSTHFAEVEPVDGATGFGGRLRELRAAAGLTQKRLAERASISRDTVAQLEQGRYEPTWPTVLALASALGVGVESFQTTPVAKAAPGGPGRPKTAAAEKPTRRRSNK
jgi:transcriptional regulator with XRE-family HTH domain